jgi:type II secretory pathway pseudopilin PulG
MTLLEAVAALVIVGLSAVGWIGLAQGTQRTTRDAIVWERVVSTAESAMEAALLATSSPGVLSPDASSDGLRTTVTVRPHAPGISEVIVTTVAPDGTPFVLHRLVRDAAP